MDKEYQDNPYLIEAWIETLSDKERGLLDQGYVLALLGVIELCVETKRKLLEKTMDEENEPHYRAQLLSRVHILDIFEKHFKERISVLEPTFQQ